jgi:hypothetical protein
VSVEGHSCAGMMKTSKRECRAKRVRLNVAHGGFDFTSLISQLHHHHLTGASQHKTTQTTIVSFWLAVRYVSFRSFHFLCRLTVFQVLNYGYRRIHAHAWHDDDTTTLDDTASMDMCLEDRITGESLEGASLRPHQRVKQKEGINALSFIMLHNVNILEQESIPGRGWIARMFLVPWPLIAFILAHSLPPERASRPRLKLSVREPNSCLQKWLCCSPWSASHRFPVKPAIHSTTSSSLLGT